MHRFRFKLKSLFAFVALAGCLTVAAPHLRPGIRIVIENTGQTWMRSVNLLVTGNRHAMGDLAPGTARELIVAPTGESGLEIEFMDEDGVKVHLNAGGYFEPGYRGRFSVWIKDGVIIRRWNKVNIF